MDDNFSGTITCEDCDLFLHEEPAKCDVLWCEENAVSGGNAWRETGYWSVCSDHATYARQGWPQPIMKQSATDRENTRLPDGTLPTKF